MRTITVAPPTHSFPVGVRLGTRLLCSLGTRLGDLGGARARRGTCRTMADYDFSGKRALVTGAGKGIALT